MSCPRLRSHHSGLLVSVTGRRSVCRHDKGFLPYLNLTTRICFRGQTEPPRWPPRIAQDLAPTDASNSQAMASQGESSSSDPKGKKDFSTAILEMKKLLNQLEVDEATNDNSSMVAHHPDTIEKLQLFCGDTVLLKGTK